MASLCWEPFHNAVSVRWQSAQPPLPTKEETAALAREASDNPNPPLATNSKAKPPIAMAIIAPATAIRGFERSRALRAPAVLSGGFDLTARFEGLSLLPVRPLLRVTGSTR